MLIWASFPVLRLTSTRAVKKSVNIRFTYSLVALVTNDREANDRTAISLFFVDYLNIKASLKLLFFLFKNKERLESAQM